MRREPLSFLDHVNVGAHKEVLTSIFALGWFKGVGVIVLAIYTYLFPEGHKVLYAIYGLILMDTATGLLAACKAKNVSSSGFFRSLIKCMVFFCMIATGILVDKVVPIAFASLIIQPFLAMTEALSVLENCARLGVPIPQRLVKMLRMMGDADNNLNKKD